tara:strand:- start:527 stop:1471 length:945 start_codon:yes stop_codon:yes gene_type:complete
VSIFQHFTGKLIYRRSHPEIPLLNYQDEEVSKMNKEQFLKEFSTFVKAPNGIEHLRKLILKIAMLGALVPHDEDEGRGHSLLEPMIEVMQEMIQNSVIRKPRYEMGRDLNPIPYEIPAHWTWVELGDVGAIVGGGTPKSTEAKFWADGEDIPWLTPADMSALEGRLIQRGRRDITSEGLARSSTSLVPAGTVLFSSRAPIGHVGIAANPLCTNQGFKSCVPFNPEMSEFIYYYLMKAGPEVNENATGTTFNEVSGKQVAAIPFPLPPLGEMLRIVSKLDELFALCDDLEGSLSHTADLQGKFAEAAKESLMLVE